MSLDVINGLLDGSDFFSLFVGDLALELLLKRHHQFGVEESAPRSSTNVDSFFTSVSFTPSCSATIFHAVLRIPLMSLLLEDAVTCLPAALMGTGHGENTRVSLPNCKASGVNPCTCHH